MPSNKLLLNDFTIVTMNRNREVLEHAHLIVENGQIQEVAAGPATGDFAEVIDGGGRQVLMPGLVNTHCHAPMTLMRGYGRRPRPPDLAQRLYFPSGGQADPRRHPGGHRAGRRGDDRQRYHHLRGHVLLLRRHGGDYPGLPA